MPTVNAATWRRIRQLRSDKPSEAAGERPTLMVGRRAVFSAALEQSEQLFAAAAAADEGIRP